MNAEDDSQPREGEHAPSNGNEEITTTPPEAEQNEELPQEPLEDFAWDELESRYRTMMQTKDDEILEVAKEYEALADVGHSHYLHSNFLTLTVLYGMG